MERKNFPLEKQQPLYFLLLSVLCLKRLEPQFFFNNNKKLRNNFHLKRRKISWDFRVTDGMGVMEGREGDLRQST